MPGINSAPTKLPCVSSGSARSVSGRGLGVPLVVSLVGLCLTPTLAQAHGEVEFLGDSPVTPMTITETTPTVVETAMAQPPIADDISSPVTTDRPVSRGSQGIGSMPTESLKGGPGQAQGVGSVGPSAIELDFALDDRADAKELITLDHASPPGIVAVQTIASGLDHPSGSQEQFQERGVASWALEQLFVGGSDSLVAKAVGSAEGTRTVTGEKTWAYYGHRDPGNGVWNLGSFSYQHGARSPEQADQKQLLRLTRQAEQLRRQAQQLGLTLNLLEELNGIDLANQSPRAALSRGGYIERLQQAQRQGLVGSEAVIWARTRSFLNPDTGRWQAPGLGNTERSITADQARRFQAIEQVLLNEGDTQRGGNPSLTQSVAEPKG